MVHACTISRARSGGRAPFDCAACGCALRANGVVAESARAVRPWRERSFYARDPFGNPLCFVERGTEFLGRR